MRALADYIGVLLAARERRQDLGLPERCVIEDGVMDAYERLVEEYAEWGLSLPRLD
jgi:hypothetical protein